jgi:Spy/CpxP family protein refolding chaperone
MKKSILIGLGLAVSLASTAIAQDKAQGKQRRDRDKDHGDQIDGRMGRGGPDGLLLKGITLTEGQRAQIAQLRKTQRAQLDAKRTASQGDLGRLREAHDRGDTAAIRAAKEQRRTVLAQERAQHIAAIRNVLTAQQRVQFDKNVAELKAREAERAQRAGR